MIFFLYIFHLGTNQTFLSGTNYIYTLLLYLLGPLISQIQTAPKGGRDGGISRSSQGVTSSSLHYLLTLYHAPLAWNAGS
jgi:hypothetical protein